MRLATCLMRRLTLLLVFLACSLSLRAEVPDGWDLYSEGWHLAGEVSSEFEVGVTNGTNNSSVGYVRSVVDKPSGFGTLMQKISAADYRGARLRFSGMVKTHDVQEWAGLWMRIDGPARERLGFDNMSERPISNSTNWSRYEIVLYVPKQAEAIAFGVLLVGSGEVHIDDLHFDGVGQDTAVSTGERSEFPSEPRNLSFEE